LYNNKKGGRFSDVETVSGARVPVAKMTHIKTNTPCDVAISDNNELAVLNTQVGFLPAARFSSIYTYITGPAGGGVGWEGIGLPQAGMECGGGGSRVEINRF
jgi:hypothetical protein